ncbi:hypothetical protein BJ165DRAFT_1531892 [Panaeolus papilionaceus]|nr:hypothetical protein BJ165DRAFT_1531892 [Panaeolus papilionaceus]
MEYKNIEVTEPVSAVQDGEGSSIHGRIVLIMGPTGSGKSSFIEALGLKGTPRISSNDLDGCTQTICAYRLNNVTRNGDVIHLVDSPGFADSKISEMSIVTMLQRWIGDHSYFHRILYFTPITSVRLPRTQRQVLQTFQALSGIKAAVEISINFIEAGTNLTRFYNTQESALSILDGAFGRMEDTYFSIETYRISIKGSPFANNLLTDLQNRIQNLHSHIATLQDELARTEVQGDELLVSTLRPRIEEAQNELTRFSKELHESDLLPSPSPAEFSEV